MACSSIQSLHYRLPSSHPSTQTKIETCRHFNFKASNFHLSKLQLSPATFSITTRCRISVAHHNKTTKGSSFICSVGVEETNNEPEEVISGEWPENFSLLNYDDLRAYLEPEIFKDKLEPSALLGEVMSTTIRTATIDQTLEEIEHHFDFVSGLPVINDGLVCIGVVSRKDKEKASNGLQSKVGEVMSSPAVTLTPDKTVLEAAVQMLKLKFHRIPIVNEGGQIVGMVTRTDIFNALEGLPA